MNLTIEEQTTLVEAYKRGDKEAGLKLHDSVLPWMLKLGWRFHLMTGWDFDEIRAELSLAFFFRLPGFDPSRAQLTSYVAIVIPQQLRQRVLRDRLVRAPSHYNGEGNSAHKQLQKTKCIASLSKRFDDDGDAYSDLITDKSAPCPVEESIREEQLAVAREAIRGLDPRLQEIFRLRFEEQLTLDEASEQLGITRERVRQLEARAMKSVRRRYDAIVERKGRLIPYVAESSNQPTLLMEENVNATTAGNEDLFDLLDQVTPEAVKSQLEQIEREKETALKAYARKKAKLKRLANMIGLAITPPREKKATTPADDATTMGRDDMMATVKAILQEKGRTFVSELAARMGVKGQSLAVRMRHCPDLVRLETGEWDLRKRARR